MRLRTKHDLRSFRADDILVQLVFAKESRKDRITPEKASPRRTLGLPEPSRNFRRPGSGRSDHKNSRTEQRTKGIILFRNRNQGAFLFNCELFRSPRDANPGAQAEDDEAAATGQQARARAACEAVRFARTGPGSPFLPGSRLDDDDERDRNEDDARQGKPWGKNKPGKRARGEQIHAPHVCL